MDGNWVWEKLFSSEDAATTLEIRAMSRRHVASFYAGEAARHEAAAAGYAFRAAEIRYDARGGRVDACYADIERRIAALPAEDKALIATDSARVMSLPPGQHILVRGRR